MDRFSTGNPYPYFIRKPKYVSIATEDFSPMEDASESATNQGTYSQRGFLVRALGDGNLYAIPHQDYVDNGYSLTGLLPQKFPMSANSWAEFVVIKVYAKNDASYATTALDATDYIGIGIL